MLVLLPPSETKRDGGGGPPLTLDALSHHELDPLRKELVDELVGLAADVDTSRAALGLSPGQDAEIARNAALWTAPTTPALLRYIGVFYDALDVISLRGTAAARAQRRLAVGSALFGLLRATDPVPAYRLSASAALPGRPTLAARWRPALSSPPDSSADRWSHFGALLLFYEPPDSITAPKCWVKKTCCERAPSGGIVVVQGRGAGGADEEVCVVSIAVRDVARPRPIPAPR